MRIILDYKNYTPFDYSPYLERGEPVAEPKSSKYVVGQLVAVKSLEDDKEDLAVVLGCIDEEFGGDLRLDLCGMTSIDRIRPAVVTDFGKSNVRYSDAIYKECQGYKVTKDWETGKYTFQPPKF